MTTTRQTISYLTRRFAQAGIHPNSKRGQNFLVDLNLVELLVREADLQPGDVVLEVGTGTGSLTLRLADRAAAVVTVEVDPYLHQMARQELIGRDNVVMLRQDALRNKNNLHPVLLEALGEQMRTRPGSRLKLVANLPFHIATPLISNLLVTSTVPASMTVTIQKELADRITARPSTKAYGALSVWVQTLCQTQLIRILPPSVFWPRPKVSSAILRIVPLEAKRAEITDLHAYHDFVRALFFHRRKFLRRVLQSAFKDRLTKTDIDQVLAQRQLGPECRAEQLAIPEIVALYYAFRARLEP